MYNNLILYRNELKNKNIPKYKIVGIVVELIFSKEIFKNNKEIGVFLKKVFNIEFKNYIMKSRTIIVSKICKYMTCSTNDNYKTKLIEFINEQIEILKNSNNIKEKRNQFNGWINKI
ncbi:hypothetical protein FDB52_07000 [Clostridium botulinum]|nr:hypothetical protein [Clostridium botulinum]NFN48296.1 hypothetical protein [Clostridium botulinum]